MPKMLKFEIEKICINCLRHIANKMAMPTPDGPICSLPCAKELIGADAWHEWMEEEMKRRSIANLPKRHRFRIVAVR